MSLLKILLERPPTWSAASKYTVMNGAIYLAAGALLIAWPHAAQTIFRERAFVGNEEALIRVLGMAVAVIGWLYVFGGRSGSHQIVAASVIDRLVLVPAVLLPLALVDVFPHFMLAFALFDPLLGIGAWIILGLAPTRWPPG